MSIFGEISKKPIIIPTRWGILIISIIALIYTWLIIQKAKEIPDNAIFYLTQHNQETLKQLENK